MRQRKHGAAGAHEGALRTGGGEGPVLLQVRPKVQLRVRPGTPRENDARDGESSNLRRLFENVRDEGGIVEARPKSSHRDAVSAMRQKFCVALRSKISLSPLPQKDEQVVVRRLRKLFETGKT